MRARSLYFGVIIGLLAGLLISVPVTIADWGLNPSEIFHNELGTNWAVVAETALSWFLPVAVPAFIGGAIVHAWIVRVQSK